MGGGQSCMASPEKPQHTSTTPCAVPPPSFSPTAAAPVQADGTPGTFPIAKVKPKLHPGHRPGASPSAGNGQDHSDGSEAVQEVTQDSADAGSTASGTGVVLQAGSEASDGARNDSRRRSSRRCSASGTAPGSSGAMASPRDEEIAELLSMEAPALPGVGVRPSPHDCMRYRQP